MRKTTIQVHDDGHDFTLPSYDGGEPIRLIFVKRNDPPEKYPGNEDAYPGTQIQEVLRALMNRLQYVNKQFPCDQTEEVEANMARSIWLLEQRHAERHGEPSAMNNYDLLEIDLVDHCAECGHIVCFCSGSMKHAPLEDDG